MKRLLLLIVLTLCLYSCETKKTTETSNLKNDEFVIGHKDVIHSDILKEDRSIWVYLPESAKDDSTSLSKYPVLYILDAWGHFHSITGVVKNLSKKSLKSILPEMIVVGIQNTDRTRDLTPTHVNKVFGDSIFPKTSGGGKYFLEFIEKELIPYIENNYPVTIYRTFVGHSFGGLTVINTLVERPSLFNNFAALDPSLWWDDQILLKRSEKTLSSNKYDEKSLYVGIANTMDEGKMYNEVENDTTKDTRHIRSILQFVKNTESMSDNGLNFKWKYYENDHHGSVPLISGYDALRFFFSWYDLKGVDEFFYPDFNHSADDLINLIELHFKDVSNHFGYRVYPPESTIDQLAYQGMRNPEGLNKSFALFNMNIQNYPNSTKVYKSMGDWYLAKQDSLKALDFFTKALEKGDNTSAQEKMDMLKENIKN